MRRISFFVAGLVLAIATVAAATPAINSAVVITRVWNDCPGSTLSFINNYPALISIDDQNVGCIGYANLHAWRFSTDGAIPAEFANGDAFRFGADLLISGTGDGEAGLQITPWWSMLVDGRFNVRSTDGEIACFGGRLPFFTFSNPGFAGFDLHYQKGLPIHLEMIYLPNGLSSANPATVEYKLVYQGIPYTSGPRPYDEGNPAEDPPHGVWGMLTPAQVGGHMQFFVGQSGPTGALHVEWSNILFEPLTIAITPATWGGVKSLFR
jgi:hypothetical protein